MSTEVDPTRTAVLFEFYVRNIWPWQRRWAGGKVSKRCCLCAASEQMIPLDNRQVCEACRAQGTVGPIDSSRNEKDEKEISSLFQQYQQKGEGLYDVVVMFSGGKDSCYMVQRLKNQFPKLRILTVSIDNNFMSPIAKKNIYDTLPKLNVDHVFIRPHRDFYLKLFRYTLTHLNSEGSYGTADFSEGEFMLDATKKLAQEKRIPLIACGYSRYQVQNGLRLESFESPAEKERPARTEIAGLALEDIYTAEERQIWWSESDARNPFLPRLLFPFYAWDLPEEDVKKQVVDWGLISKKTQSPIVTNHQLIPLFGVIDVHQTGYSSFEKEFCRMVREGKADRLHWLYTFEFLEYTAKTGFLVRPTVDDLLSKLEMTRADVGIHYR